MNPLQVWYLEAGHTDGNGEFVRASSGTGVLMTVRQGGAPIKLLVTAQHVLRSGEDHGGPYYPHVRVWVPGTAYNKAQSFRASVFAALSPPDDEPLADANDFAFLKFDSRAGGIPTTRLHHGELKRADCVTVVGYNGGAAEINSRRGVVEPILDSGWKLLDEHPALALAFLSDGNGKPTSGASGGGVYWEGQYVGLYRGESAPGGTHAFLPVRRLREWCAECKHDKYELVSGPGTGDGPADPRTAALQAALRRSDFFADTPSLARFLDAPEFTEIRALETPEEKAGALAVLIGSRPGEFSARLLERVRGLGFGRPDDGVFTALEATHPQPVPWRTVDDLKRTLAARGVFGALDERRLGRLLAASREVWDGASLYLPAFNGSGERRLCACIDTLANAPRQGERGLPFVAWLALGRRDLKLRESDLARWAAALGQPVSPATRRPASRQPEPQVALQIVVIPAAERGPYELLAYWEEGGHVNGPSLTGDAATAAALPARIQKLIEEFLDQSPHRDAPLRQVELFLPRDLLTEPWEQTVKIALVEDVSQSIGEVWPVVVRSMERHVRESHGHRGVRHVWKRKWETLERRKPTAKIVPWACANVSAQQGYLNFFDEPDRAGLMVLWPLPPDAPPMEARPFAGVLLSKGLSLGVWVRAPEGDPRAVRKEVDRQLRLVPVEELAARVKKYRTRNQTFSFAFGGITLFYDRPVWKADDGESDGVMCATA